MAQVPILGLRTHAQRVCSLYKKALRTLESYYHYRDEFRYQAVLLRSRFDAHAKECDMIRAAQILKAGQEEHFRFLHPDPKLFPRSPGGTAYDREVIPADWVLDYWHPLEKAHYPEYFKRREQRKKEYLAWWEKEYGASCTDEDRPTKH